MRQARAGSAVVSRSGVASSRGVVLAAELQNKFVGHKTGGGETVWEAISSQGVPEIVKYSREE